MPFHMRCGEAVDPSPRRNIEGETLYWCPNCAGHVREEEVWLDGGARIEAFESATD